MCVCIHMTKEVKLETFEISRKELTQQFNYEHFLFARKKGSCRESSPIFGAVSFTLSESGHS